MQKKKRCQDVHFVVTDHPSKSCGIDANDGLELSQEGCQITYASSEELT